MPMWVSERWPVMVGTEKVECVKPDGRWRMIDATASAALMPRPATLSSQNRIHSLESSKFSPPARREPRKIRRQLT
ncbi:hypothetical protein SBA5_220107 [Candidatus Sulfotelmatomonas gaucii]|uniref:Uncharacterized protein n=1 Tax=Candidatus Sulfuritelmatomonas gaucii TaxID=2043161 RepID=A0A2N9L7Q6_9BACT|nr:hypothetical protein SBA5_220107 [Candidatus Sulfotelmatomonas gaucii]